MKRQIIAGLLLIGSISGCISTSDGPETGGMRANYGQSFGPPTVPGVKGPYGEGVPMAAPYNTAPPGSQMAAMRMMQNSIPTNMMQMHPNGMLTPPNVSGMPGSTPGMPGLPSGMSGMPGATPGSPPSAGNPFQKTSMTSMTPDAGVINANVPPGMRPPGGVTPAQFSSSSPTGPMFPAQRTQVFFTKPAGMKVFWISQGADGKPNYSATPLETPGRYNFAQAAIYRLKLEKIPGRPGLELYPTLEVVPTSPKTNEFLAHNSVPIEFTEDDFKQVVDRNCIVKVIYLPDPQFQDAAGAGPDEIVSTRLEPGQDPIQEALRRGSILLVVRIGNIDQGLNHSPSMTAPVPGGPPALMKPPGAGVQPFFQVPFPLTPITPGVGNPAPNPLPVMPGVNPPLLSVPKLPLPPVGKPELIPEPNKNEANKVVVPSLPLPPPPALNPDEAVKPGLPILPPPPGALQPIEKPFSLPVPNPADKGANNSSGIPMPPAPVIPASSNKDGGPQLPSISLPALPPVDTTTTPLPPELPMIPVLPGSGKN